MIPAKWYIINVYSGFESKICESLREQAARKGIEEQFVELIVPSENVTELRRGKKVETERKFYPGYILAKMSLTDEAWSLVKNTPRVTNFLGGGAKAKPIAIPEAEAMRVINQVQEGIEKPRPSITFDVGEEIRVKDGAFASFNGVVEEVDEDKARLKISVSIFGRATPVELDYNQVEKL